MPEVKMELKVRTALRPLHSKPVADVVLKGHDPLVVITFPNVADKDSDLMIVDVDATGFDPLELAAMLRATSMAIMQGLRTDVTTDGPTGDISAEDLAWAKSQLPEDDGK